jgi:hypothetical protein
MPQPALRETARHVPGGFGLRLGQEWGRTSRIGRFKKGRLRGVEAPNIDGLCRLAVH